MGTFLGVLGIMALAALLLGLWFWLDARRTVRRLDRMLSTAIDGGFEEEQFDESAPSALESRMARFLNGSARSLRGVQRQRESIGRSRRRRRRQGRRGSRFSCICSSRRK